MKHRDEITGPISVQTSPELARSGLRTNTMVAAIVASVVLVLVATIAAAIYILSAPDAPAVASSTQFNAIGNEFERGARGIQNPQSPECVDVSPSESGDPVVSPATCGTSSSTYRIVQRANYPGDCIADVDEKYSYTENGQHNTLCLDYDWSTGSCIEVAKDYAASQPCDSKPRLVKPVSVITGVVDVSYCAVGGFPHPVRKFTVCTNYT